MSPFEELITWLAEGISSPRARQQKILTQSIVQVQINQKNEEFDVYEKEN